MEKSCFRPETSIAGSCEAEEEEGASAWAEEVIHRGEVSKNAWRGAATAAKRMVRRIPLSPLGQMGGKAAVAEEVG